jgi:hypothetical protein
MVGVVEDRFAPSLPVLPQSFQNFENLSGDNAVYLAVD